MRIRAFNENHDEKGQFAEGDGGGGSSAQKENPIADVWRRQAAKMSKNQLKNLVEFRKQFANKVLNETDKIAERVITEELAKRGVKVFGR